MLLCSHAHDIKYNPAEELQPGSPNGMFLKSFGFLSRIHLETSPQKALNEQRQNISQYIGQTYLLSCSSRPVGVI